MTYPALTGRRLLLPGVGLAALLALPAAAAAQTATATPDPNVIYACYVPSSGTVYRIRTTDTKQNCASTAHVLFSFNQTGPQGPKGDKGDTGLQGEKGDKGDTGAQGPAGTAGEGSTAYFTETTTSKLSGPAMAALSLPAGSYLLVAKVRARNANASGDGAINCSIGVPVQLAASESDVSAIHSDARVAFPVQGAFSSASPFTAFLNCADDNGSVFVLPHTNMTAVRLSSVVVQ